ncbi:MAG: hypothetical protein JWQ79_2545 [Mucilaginibacter sp.]|nr:hypothetical protein [Mucilaginibacter sp.]
MNIDTEAYRLVTLLEFKAITIADAKSEPDNIIYGIPHIGNLGEVEGFQSETQDTWGAVNSMILNEGGTSTGFSVENYKLVKTIAAIFLNQSNYSSLVDQYFIENEIFQWVIAIYKSNKSTMSLTTFLEKRIDEEIKNYTYYFKLSPIGIENPINFGTVKIFAFTEEYLRADYDTRNPENRSPWEKHKESFNHILDAIVVEITVKAVRSKAEVLAKAEAGLAVNAFKCFFYPESITGHYQVFDLDFRSTEVIFSKFVTKDNTDGRMKITMQRVQGTLPIVIKKAMIPTLKKSGLDLIHDFLINRKHDELHLLILRGIEQLGIAISTRNLHERIVQLVSYFELFLNDENNNSKSKPETNLKNQILPVLVNPNDLEAYKLKIRRIYDVRNKYLHNRILNIIDMEELFYVQKVAFAFLKQLIKLNETLKTKQQFFIHFGINI